MTRPSRWLNGSYMFLSDLVRKTTFNNEVTFVRISSYEGTQSTGSITQKSGIDIDIEGRDIIIVEDIVETGHSINHMLQTRWRYAHSFSSPRSISTTCLSNIALWKSATNSLLAMVWTTTSLVAISKIYTF